MSHPPAASVLAGKLLSVKPSTELCDDAPAIRAISAKIYVCVCLGGGRYVHKHSLTHSLTHSNAWQPLKLTMVTPRRINSTIPCQLLMIPRLGLMNP